MQFNPLYSGRGSAAVFPELDSLERAQQRAGALAIKGEEMKLQKALKDKDTFQKMLDIDPIMAISTANQTKQAAALESYNNKWSDRYVKNKGSLSFADEIEMNKDKKLLQAVQGKMLADQEQFKQAEQTILRDTRGYYDRDAYTKAKQKYLDTGELPTVLLEVAPQDIKSYLAKLPATEEWGETIKEDITDEKGNIVASNYVPYEYGRTKPQAQASILDAMSHEPFIKTILNDFNKLPESEQYKYLKDYDTNRDMKLDPAEKVLAYQNVNLADNPIAKWAMNNEDYLASAMDKKRMTPRNIPSPKVSSTNWSVPIDEKNNNNDKYDVLPNQTFGIMKFDSFLNLGQEQNTPKTMTIQKFVNLDTGEELTFNNAAEFKTVGYSPDKDMVIVSITKKATSPTTSVNLREGQDVGLKGSQYDDFLKKKPFAIHRESLISKLPKATTPKMTMMEYKAKFGTTEGYKEYLSGTNIK